MAAHNTDKIGTAGLNRRAVSSLFMTFSFVLLIPSGILLHVFSSDQFEARRHILMTIHNACALIFVVSASAHLIFNRKTALSYLRAKSVEHRVFSRELIVVALLFAALLTVALLHIAVGG